MGYNNKNNRLLMEVKSGEARGFGFTIKQKTGNTDSEGNPEYAVMRNLGQYNVLFQVKQYPYFSVPALIEHIITTEPNNSTGQILNNGLDGQFQVRLTESDLENLVPSQQYYVIITLVNGDTKIIISGEGDNSGILRFCKS